MIISVIGSGSGSGSGVGTEGSETSFLPTMNISQTLSSKPVITISSRSNGISSASEMPFDTS